jgi:hypothetical protein
MTRDSDQGSDPARIEAETLDDFFDSLDFLDETQLLELAASWKARDTRAHEDAWTQAVACAAVGGLTTAMEEARGAALSWATRGTNVPWPYGRMEDMWLDLRRGAGPALADAAVAMVLGHRLDEAARAVLLGPWLNVAGRA